MTSLAAWPGIDSRGLSTLYIVADSRISWPGSSDRWELGAKVFASSLTPDIFGFYGDVLVPSMVIPRLVEGPLLEPLANAQDNQHAVDGLAGLFFGCQNRLKALGHQCMTAT